MRENMTQDQRLDYLVEEFKADSIQYKDLRTPADIEGKRRILRSLMNIRMPGKMDDAVLAVQDAYLRERIRENGVIELSDIPEPEMKKVSINISSPRLDSICAECFGLSRTKAAEAIKKGLVSINWQICDNVSRELTGGERISLRGKGKVRFSGITGKSKKGRLFAQIEKY